MSLSSLTGSQAAGVASVLQEPAEKFGNDATLELMWAVKAHQHAETHFKLLLSVPPSSLRLTKLDNEIYSKFRLEFPSLDISKIDVEAIKLSESKESWRQFCNEFEGQVEDWNMATLLRINADGEVSQDNTIIVPRIQFLAIEIARNREGLNEKVGRKLTNTQQS